MRQIAARKDQDQHPLPDRHDLQFSPSVHGEECQSEPAWIRKLADHLLLRRHNGNSASRNGWRVAQSKDWPPAHEPVAVTNQRSTARRRLAAILFADVAGYTRLMDRYEADTHTRLMRLFDEVVDAAIAAAGGCVVKNTGDGFLARFDSVGGAVECAVAIQRSVADREASQAPEKRLAFRMGLHVADIVIETRDVYGAGVNIAARLQQLAEPGSITISASVCEQLGGNLLLPTIDLGDVRLKNIHTPVRAFRILALPELGQQREQTAAASWQLRSSVRAPPFAEYGDVQATVSLARL